MKPRRPFLMLFSLFFLMVSCPSLTPPTDEELAQAFRDAIEDAAVAEPSEICRSLTAIVDYNDKLVWSGEGENRKVLVVTWTSWTGYDDLVGKSLTVSKAMVQTTRDTWVTVVPEIRNFRRNSCIPANRLTLRIEQLLGLPPNSGKTRFVEFWVSPRDLFRPSPDPEITDHEAEIDFPMSDEFVLVSDSYIQWFSDLAATSYGENGYPWTRLGYTYDWGNPFCEVGLSEFVIREGATIDVHSVTLNDEYLR